LNCQYTKRNYLKIPLKDKNISKRKINYSQIQYG